MLQIVPLAIFALASFTTAAPVTSPNEVLPMMDSTMNSNYMLPAMWKRDQQDIRDLNKVFESAIIHVLTQQDMLVKRQTDTPFELESLFRSLFDKIVAYVIEVTPLNAIVHGNYDMLYALFTEKIGEAIAGFGQGFGQGPPAGLPEFNLFGSPDATDSDVASAPATDTPFDLLGGAPPAIQLPSFDLFGGQNNEAPPALPDIFNFGKNNKKDEDKDYKVSGDNGDNGEDDECDEDDNEEDNDSEDNDDEDEEDDDDEVDYKRKWKKHFKKHHHHKD